MSRAEVGVRILAFTHFQSGPTCTQLLACWVRRDQVERPWRRRNPTPGSSARHPPRMWDSAVLHHVLPQQTPRSRGDPKNIGKELLERPDPALRCAWWRTRSGRAGPMG